MYTVRMTDTDRTLLDTMPAWRRVSAHLRSIDRRFAGEIDRMLEGRAPNDPAVQLTFPLKQAALVMTAAGK